MDPLQDQVRTEMEAAIGAGRKIEAIKLYRNAVAGSDLVDAKKAVEDMEARMRVEHPENFGPPGSKTGCLGMALWVAGMLAAGMSFLTLLAVVWK